MSSKFENFAIGRAVAKLLNLKGVKNFPTELATDVLQPVITVEGAGAALIESTNSISYTLDGIPSQGVQIIDSASESSPLVRTTIDQFIDDLSIYLTFNGAGATAFNGKYVTLSIRKITSNGAQNIYCYHDPQNWKIETGLGQYPWTLRNGSCRVQSQHYTSSPRGILCLAGQKIDATIQSLDGTNFPVGTGLQVGISSLSDNGMGTLRPY